MNIFFQLSGGGFPSAVQIPCFRNDGLFKSEPLRVFGASIKNQTWYLRGLEEFRRDSFYEIDSSSAPEDELYFYVDDNSLKAIEVAGKLLPSETFTNTSPNFRANLSIRNSFGAFSSYQAEYPYGMTVREGCVVSEPGLLIEEVCTKAGVFLRNVFHLPTHEKRLCYLIDDRDKSVVEQFEIFTNKSNFVDLTSHITKLKNYIICIPNMLCAPIYVMENSDYSLSFEHTHPPNAYIGRINHFEIINRFKQRYVEIVNRVHCEN